MEAGTTLPTRNGRFPIKPLPDEVFAIEEETAFLWAFGYLSYADFLGEPHQVGFAADGSVMVPNRWQFEARRLHLRQPNSPAYSHQT